MMVSIVIPMYMCESYVTPLLDIICGQSYTDLDIICVIDGSPDDTLSRAKAYEEKDPRVRVIVQPHAGAGVARNTGLSLAQGEYIIFADADDLYAENFVEKMVLTAEETQADVIVCQFSRKEVTKGFHKDNCGYISNKIPKKVVSSQEIEDLLNVVSPNPFNKLIRKTLIEENHLSFSSTKSSNDVVFGYTSLMCANKIAFINDSLIIYRKNDNPASISSNRFKSIEGLLTINDELYKWLTERQLIDLYAESFYKKWRIRLYFYLDLGKDEMVTKQIAEYLATFEPFKSMSDDELEQKAGLITAISRIKYRLNLRSIFDWNYRNDNTIYNLIQIRKELSTHWGKKIKAKDSIIKSLIKEIKDHGIKGVLIRLMKHIRFSKFISTMDR